MNDSICHTNNNRDSLKGFSIKLKRLQWKEIMKKKFWKKRRISRSCISRICRQLLNIELKMKRDKARQPLSAIEENKSSHTHTEQNIRKLEVIPKFERSAEPLRKKFKQGNENYPTCTEKSPGISESLTDEDNDFAGFETNVPTPTSAGRKNAFSLTQNGAEAPRSSITLTKSGVKFIATKSVAIPKLKSVPSSSPLKSQQSPPIRPIPEARPSEVNSDGGIKSVKIESKSDDEQLLSSLQNGNEDVEDDEQIENLSEEKTQKDDLPLDNDGSNEKNTKADDLHLNGIEKEITTKCQESPKDGAKRDSERESSPEEGKKDGVKRDSEKESSPEEVMSVSDTDSCQIVKSDGTAGSRRGSLCVLSETTTLSDSDSSSDSSSSESEDDEESADKEEALNTSFDPSKFLSCDINTDTAEDESQPEIPFIKSQNYQLNCSVQIKVVPLLLKDITNTFCYRNNISGICGFRIRRLLQMLKFKARINKPFYRYCLPEKNDVKTDDTDPHPSPVPFLDPFTHSLFEPIIKRDRRFVKSMQNQKNKNKPQTFSPLVSTTFQGGHHLANNSQMFRLAAPPNVGNNPQFNFYRLTTPRSHPYSTENSNVLKSSSNRQPLFLGGPNASGGSSFTLLSNGAIPIASDFDKGKRVEALRAVRLGESFISSQGNPLTRYPPNGNIVLPPGSNCSYVVLPQCSTPSLFQIRGGHVIYQPASGQSVIQTSSVQTPQLYKGIHQPTPPSGTSLVAPTHTVSSTISMTKTSSAQTSPLFQTNGIDPSASTHSMQSGTSEASPVQVAPGIIALANRENSTISNHATPSYIAIPSQLASHSHATTVPTPPPQIGIPSLATTPPYIPVASPSTLHSTQSGTSQASLVSAPVQIAPGIIALTNRESPAVSSHASPSYVAISSHAASPSSHVSQVGMHSLVATSPYAPIPSQGAPISHVMNQHSTTPTSSGSGMNLSLMPAPHNQGPPPLKLGNSHIGKPPANTQNLSLSQPPQLKKMGSSPPLPLAPPPLPKQSQLLHQTPSYGTKRKLVNEWEAENVPIDIRKWLHQVCQPQGPCNKNVFFISVNSLDVVIDRLKVFVSFGFPNKTSSLLNAAYQMLVSMMCCPQHVAEFIRKSNVINRLSILPLVFDQAVNAFREPVIPIMPCISSSVPSSSLHDLFILKRFVFAVDRETRVVLYPLPPFCIPKDSETVDKITVVALISPRLGLGPGLVIFPHSILNRQLRLSLGETGNLGKNWAVSAHQRGGLTQSMMIEFMNGEGLRWLVDIKDNLKSPQLAVDWWFCIELKDLNNFFSQFTRFSLPLFFPSHRDPLDVCLGVSLTNMWGLLTRSWKNTFHAPLDEERFPKFIHKTLDVLCEPSRLQAWCRASGLQPVDYAKSKSFLEQNGEFNF